MRTIGKPVRSRYRWVICALLFFATTVNYMDRQVLGILAPTLQKEIGWSESQYGLIVTAFQAAYAIGLLGVGRMIDLVGTRVGYIISVIWWSLAAMAHAAARSAFGFGVARFALGLGEAGNFPAAVKVVAEWFPKKERALATGLFNAGSNVGAVAAPLLVPWLTLHYGWRWAFLVTGAVGFFWVFWWWAGYRAPQDHPRVSQNELDHIFSDPAEPTTPIPWMRLFAHRQTVGLVVARFITDPVWWFYLYWAPKFLDARHGIGLAQIGLPLVIIYVAADGGSVFGGWLSGYLLRRGWSVNAARKTAILVCISMITPIIFASYVSSSWMAVLLLSLATAGHQGWAANIFTIVSDMYPRRAVGSMVGICGFGGAVGGMLVASATGFLLEKTGSYLPIFILAGTSYFLALGIIHLSSPRLDPVKL
ncbi:MAG: MFS transporter [Candidatus Solibacter sp.]|nr:MFS transporter [Candidatus Solibacter sp.]